MQKQKRAILLLQSDTGKHEDFTRLRKAFLAIPGNEDIEIVLMLNCLNSERTEPDYVFTLGTVRRRAVWKSMRFCLFRQSMFWDETLSRLQKKLNSLRTTE